MSDLFLLCEHQLQRIEPYFRFRTEFRGLMTGGWSAGSSS